MSRNSIIISLAGLGVLAAGLATGAAQAQSGDDFFRDRVITIVVGFGPGGGYDRYSRVVAKNLGKHLPGNPKIIPQFMPGGGSLRMANYLFNVAPKDGTYIGMHSPVIPVFQLLRSKGFKLDVAKFNYIGRLATQNHIMMVRADTGIATLADAMKREVTVSSTGKGSPTFIYPTIMNSVLGTRFKVIMGYSGSAAGRLAIERKEVQGMTSAWISWKATAPQWIKSKYIVPLVEVGLEKSPDVSGVPLLMDLATNADDRTLLEFISSAATTGRTIAAPPGVPAARVALLRRAFDAAVRDPAFIAGAKKRRIEIDPLSGAKVQARIVKAVSIPPKLVARAKAALGYK